jgi:hypothetical protein
MVSLHTAYDLRWQLSGFDAFALLFLPYCLSVRVVIRYNAPRFSAQEQV